MSARIRPLHEFGDVMSRRKSVEPILEDNVRSNVLGWLREIQAEDELKAVDVPVRKTCMLSGPPGCGKTTLAHHLAARLGVDMLAVRADLLVSKYVGEFTKNIAGLFDAVEAAPQPVMIFLDEIDSMGGSRSAMNGGGGDNERHNGLNILLQRLEALRNGWLIAATNMPDGLDEALWRRFKMQIDVALPGDEERAAILTRYFTPYRLEDDTILDLADATAGASPALLREFAEGVKRSLILFPKMSRSVDVSSVFRSVLSAVKPHPSLDQPALWRNPEVVQFDVWPPDLGGSA
jgi:SpoVK/Ycf46/Vps4 family AAA+-type ATPase